RIMTMHDGPTMAAVSTEADPADAFACRAQVTRQAGLDQVLLPTVDQRPQMRTPVVQTTRHEDLFFGDRRRIVRVGTQAQRSTGEHSASPLATKFSTAHKKIESPLSDWISLRLFGRDGVIRTLDPLHPIGPKLRL